MQKQKNNFFALSSNELLSLNLLLTISLSNGLNSNQLNLLGNFICALGQNILVIQGVIGNLPDNDTTYTALEDARYPVSADTGASQGMAVAELAAEISELKEKISQLEVILGLEEA